MSWLRVNWAVVVLILVVGCLAASPVLFFRLSAGSAYRGIAPIMSPVMQDNAWYYAMVAEGIKGGRPWNAVLIESQNLTYPMPDLAERTVAATGKVLHLQADTILFAWRIAFVMALVFVVYGVSLFVSGSKIFSLTVSAATIGLTNVAMEPLTSWRILVGHLPSLPFTVYDRPLHPQFDALFLWAFLLMAILSLEQPAKRWRWIVTGLMLGFFMYSYVWAWTWGVVAAGFLLVQAIVSRQIRSAGAILKSLILGFIIGTPALTTLFLALRQPDSLAAAERLALVSGHGLAPLEMNAPLVIGMLCLLVSQRFANARTWRFTTAGLVSTFVAVNQQLITGLALQPDHYMLLIGSAFIVWVIVWAIWSWLRASVPRVASALLVALLLISVSCFGIFQIRIFESSRAMTLALQPLHDVTEWLRVHADRQAVVFAHQDIGLLLPVYSPVHLWWHYYAMATPIDPARIEHAAFFLFALQRQSVSEIRRFAAQDPIAFAQYFTLSTSYEQRVAFVKRELPELLKRYEVFAKEVSLAQALRTYRVDYILFDKMIDIWDPAQLGVGEKIIENERFALYAAPRF